MVVNLTLNVNHDDERTPIPPSTPKDTPIDTPGTPRTKQTVNFKTNFTKLERSLPRHFNKGNNEIIIIIGGITAVISLLSIFVTCMLIKKRDRRLKKLEGDMNNETKEKYEDPIKSDSFFVNYRAELAPSKKRSPTEELSADEKYKIQREFILESTPPCGFFSSDDVFHSPMHSEHVRSNKQYRSLPHKERSRRRTCDTNNVNKAPLHYGIHNEAFDVTSPSVPH